MSRQLLLLASIVAFLIPGIILRAQQRSTQPQQQAASGILRGTVIREDTAEPIRDVRISVGRGEAPGLALEAVVSANSSLGDGGPALRLLQQVVNSTNSAPDFAATTDSNGRFTIEGIPPGEYTIISQREGYYGSAQAVPSASSFAAPGIARETVTIASQQVASVTLTMVPGAAVSGRVLGPDGMPATNVTVEVLRIAYSNGLRTLQSINQRLSDDRGDYRLFQLPPGEYYLAVSPRNTVGASPGQPQEAQVRTYYPGATDAMNAQPITLRPGDDMSGMNLQLQSRVVSKVSGRVVNSPPMNSPTRATITLLPSNRSPLLDPRSHLEVISVTGPSNGAFEIRNVPEGVYDLYVNVSELAAVGTTPVAYGRTAIEVRRSDLSGVMVSVHRGVDVGGQVFVDGKAVLAPVEVSLQPADSSAGITVYNQAGRGPFTVQGDGSFLIPRVPEATYRVLASILSSGTIRAQNARIARGSRAGQLSTAGTQPQPALEPLPANAYVADVRYGGASVYDNGITVGTSIVSPLEVFVNTNGGTIEGTVISSAQQNPPMGTVVALIPHPDRRQNLALYHTTPPDAEGAFTISAVPPGPYKLFAWQNIPPGAHLNPDFLRKYEDRGVSINVSAGATLSQAVPLISADR